MKPPYSFSMKFNKDLLFDLTGLRYVIENTKIELIKSFFRAIFVIQFNLLWLSLLIDSSHFNKEPNYDIINVWGSTVFFAF